MGAGPVGYGDCSAAVPRKALSPPLHYPAWFIPQHRIHGMINGIDLHVEIEPTEAKRYALEAQARGANSGMASVKADIDPHFARRDED